MTDEQVVDLLKSDEPLNLARKQFSNWSAKIEQAQAQRKPITTIQVRRLEFEAVEAIVSAYMKEKK